MFFGARSPGLREFPWISGRMVHCFVAASAHTLFVSLCFSRSRVSHVSALRWESLRIWTVKSGY